RHHGSGRHPVFPRVGFLAAAVGSCARHRRLIPAPQIALYAMLNAIIRFSLRYRTLVMVLALAALLYGGYQATTLPVDIFPDLDRPRVVLLTECPGLAPEEVETLVTQPMEIALLGAPGVQAVRSQTSPGLVVIYVEFDWTTEIRSARQTVQ